MRRGVNLVEIDLLLGGAPLPMKRRIEPGSLLRDRRARRAAAVGGGVSLDGS